MRKIEEWENQMALLLILQMNYKIKLVCYRLIIAEVQN